MDDSADVIDLSFVIDSEDELDESGENSNNNPSQGDQTGPSTGAGPSNQPILPIAGLQLSPSDEHDFESLDRVVLRTNLGSSQGDVPEPKPRNVETEESTCPICFEVWTNNGIHRLVSIKCGHLFGESCILKWMAQTPRGAPSKCPKCNHPVKRRDIRKIWSSSVIAVDTAEMNKAAAQAKKEEELRIRHEHDLQNSRMAYDMLKNEMTKLQWKYERERARKIRYRTDLRRLKVTNDLTRNFSCVSFKTIPLATTTASSTHYLSYRKDEEMLVCSRQANFQHGLVKISMRDYSSNLHSIIPVHSQPIRDVQCYTNDQVSNKSLVLTASMDKTLKLTSASSQSVVLSYDLHGAVWSCCWSTTNPVTIYCSTKAKQTSILMLDIRNTSGPVASFSQTSVLGYSPIHSMTHVGPTATQRQEGIICGNLEGAFIYSFEANAISGSQSQDITMYSSQSSAILDDGNVSFGQESERTPLRVHGASCSSVSFDGVSRRWMASYKFLGKPFTHHVQGSLDQDESGEYVLKSDFNVHGGPPVPCASRTTVFTRQNGVTCMAAGSEGETYVWYGSPKSRQLESVGSSLQADNSIGRLVLHGRHPKLQADQVPSQHPDPIKDVKPIVVGFEEYLVTLSDKELEVYQWYEEPSGQLEDEETEDSDNDGEGWIKEATGQERSQDKGKKRLLEE